MCLYNFNVFFPFSSAGAISALTWSSKGSKFACCSSVGTIQVYSGSNREYVPSIRIRELQASSLSWSPDERILTTLEPEGAVKVRETKRELNELLPSVIVTPETCVCAIV